MDHLSVLLNGLDVLAYTGLILAGVAMIAHRVWPVRAGFPLGVYLQSGSAA